MSRIIGKHGLLLIAIVIALAGLVLIVSVRQLPPAIGTGDFRGYRSTSYLLLEDQDCSDPSILRDIQYRETGWRLEKAMRIWNPPWVYAWFLPLALLNFELAAWIWLFINIGLVFISVFLAWRIFVNEARDKRQLWLFFLGAILFPSTIVAIFVGQVNLLVLAGLVIFLYLALNGRDFGAGLALSLTMVKPHLIYLALPIILLAVLKERRWRILVGFGASLLISTAIVFLLRLSFIQECLSFTGSSNLLSWQTPTLPAFIQFSLDLWWVRVIGILLVPIVILLWLRFRDRLPFLIILDLTIMASIITSPFGWSYDFVVLLLPLMHLWSWLSSGLLRRLETILIAAINISMYVIYYYQRVRTPNEMYFFWVPLVIAGLYLWAYFRLPDRKSTGAVSIF